MKKLNITHAISSYNFNVETKLDYRLLSLATYPSEIMGRNFSTSRSLSIISAVSKLGIRIGINTKLVKIL